MGIERGEHPGDGAFDEFLRVDVVDVILLGEAQDVLKLVELLEDVVARDENVEFHPEEEGEKKEYPDRKRRKSAFHNRILRSRRDMTEKMICKCPLKVKYPPDLRHQDSPLYKGQSFVLQIREKRVERFSAPVSTRSKATGGSRKRSIRSETRGV